MYCIEMHSAIYTRSDTFYKYTCVNTLSNCHFLFFHRYDVLGGLNQPKLHF